MGTDTESTPGGPGTSGRPDDGGDDGDRVSDRYESIDAPGGRVVVFDRAHPESWIQSDEAIPLDWMR